MIVACENCGWEGDASECEKMPVESIPERVDGGEIMPYGECPDCGAVCHSTEVFDVTDLDAAEASAILAALRYYEMNRQGDPDERDNITHSIATGNAIRVEVMSSLDKDGIRVLRGRLIQRWRRGA